MPSSRHPSKDLKYCWSEKRLKCLRYAQAEHAPSSAAPVQTGSQGLQLFSRASILKFSHVSKQIFGSRRNIKKQNHTSGKVGEIHWFSCQIFCHLWLDSSSELSQTEVLKFNESSSLDSNSWDANSLASNAISETISEIRGPGIIRRCKERNKLDHRPNPSIHPESSGQTSHLSHPCAALETWGLVEPPQNGVIFPARLPNLCQLRMLQSRFGGYGQQKRVLPSRERYLEIILSKIPWVSLKHANWFSSLTDSQSHGQLAPALVNSEDIILHISHATSCRPSSAVKGEVDSSGPPWSEKHGLWRFIVLNYALSYHSELFWYQPMFVLLIPLIPC